MGISPGANLCPSRKVARVKGCSDPTLAYPGKAMEAPAGKEVSNTAHPAVTHDEEAKTVTTPPAAHESIEDEPAPHLHAKTYVIVLVNTISSSSCRTKCSCAFLGC